MMFSRGPGVEKDQYHEVCQGTHFTLKVTVSSKKILNLNKVCHFKLIFHFYTPLKHQMF